MFHRGEHLLLFDNSYWLFFSVRVVCLLATGVQILLILQTQTSLTYSRLVILLITVEHNSGHYTFVPDQTNPSVSDTTIPLSPPINGEGKGIELVFRLDGEGRKGPMRNNDFDNWDIASVNIFRFLFSKLSWLLTTAVFVFYKRKRVPTRSRLTKVCDFFFTSIENVCWRFWLTEIWLLSISPGLYSVNSLGCLQQPYQL